MNRILRFLKRNACKEALKWSSQFTDPAEWWNSLDKGDWMLWGLSCVPGAPGCIIERKIDVSEYLT